MYAIAHALEGMSRAEAARLAGMDRQALHDAIVRYNSEGLDGLYDRAKSGRPRRLDAIEQAALAALLSAWGDRRTRGRTGWTLPMLCAEIEQRWGKRLHPASLSRILGRLGPAGRSRRGALSTDD